MEPDPYQGASESSFVIFVRFPYGEYEHFYENLSWEIFSIETDEWRIAFLGSTTLRGDRVGIVLYAFDGTVVSSSFKLELPSSNNEAKYEDYRADLNPADGSSQALCARRLASELSENRAKVIALVSY